MGYITGGHTQQFQMDEGGGTTKGGRARSNPLRNKKKAGKITNSSRASKNGRDAEERGQQKGAEREGKQQERIKKGKGWKKTGGSD